MGEQFRKYSFLLKSLDFVQLNHANEFAALGAKLQQVQFPPQVRRDRPFHHTYAIEAYSQVTGLLLVFQKEISFAGDQFARLVRIPFVERLPAGKTRFPEVLETLQFPRLLRPDSPRAPNVPLP